MIANSLSGQNRKRIYLATVVIVLSLLSTGNIGVQQARATGSLSGPHTDFLTINISNTPDVEFLKLKAGGIELMDWPVSGTQIDDILGIGTDTDGPEGSIGLQNYKESGMFLIDLNNRCEAGPFFENATGRWCGTTFPNLSPAPGYEGTVRRVPDTADYPAGTLAPLSKWTGNVQFRRALATLRNNVIGTIVTSVGTAVQLNNPVPASFVGDPLSDLLTPTDNFLRWTGGRAAAHSILEGLGLHCTDWRVTTLTCEKPSGFAARQDLTDTRCGGNMCSLIFYARSDDPRRLTMAQLFRDELVAVGIPVDLRAVDRAITNDEVLVQLEYNLYTAGWIFLFDKDYIFDLYTDTTILPSGSKSLNYVLNTDPAYKSLASGPKFGAPTPGDSSGVNDAFKNTLKRHAEVVVNLPIYGNAATAAFKKPYWIGLDQTRPSATRGIINAQGYGPNNFFTLLNAYRVDTTDAPYGGTFKWGFKSALQDPNPITSAWLWDAYLLSTTYDTLLARDPYSVSTFRPWLSEPFQVTTWSGTTPHGALGGGSLVRVNIQPGPDRVLDSFDDIRFHSHPQLTLPGPDNFYGTADDVVVLSTQGDCSPAGFPCGKPLNGFDVEASLLYARDHLGFNLGLVADILDVVVRDRPDVTGGDTPPVGIILVDDPRILFVNATTSPTETWSLGKAVVYDTNGNGQYDSGELVLGGPTPATGARLRDDPRIRLVDTNINNVLDLHGLSTQSGNERVVYDTNGDGSYGTGEPVILGADNLQVDIYYGVTSYLVKNWVGSMSIIPSDIWSLARTPGVATDDPIPNPYQFNTRDPNNDGNRADHILYGTGAWLYNTGFDLNVGGVLAANRFYFTPARTPVDLDVTGVLDASVGTERILSSGGDDALAAVAQFQFALPYTAQRDVNYDKRTDIDDYLAVLSYFQTGSVSLSDGVSYGGTPDATTFRAWPSLGKG